MVQVTFGSMSEAIDESEIAKLMEMVRKKTYVHDVDGTGNVVTMQVHNGGEAAPDLMALFHEKQMTVTNLSVSSPTLDDVFLKYTGHQIRSEGTSGDEAAQSARQWLGLSSGR